MCVAKVDQKVDDQLRNPEQGQRQERRYHTG